MKNKKEAFKQLKKWIKKNPTVKKLLMLALKTGVKAVIKEVIEWILNNWL